MAKRLGWLLFLVPSLLEVADRNVGIVAKIRKERLAPLVAKP